jgi:uncharacterized membrane protein
VGVLREELRVATFENVVMISRPIEDVFGFLSDFENVPKWNYAVVETRKARRSKACLSLDPPRRWGTGRDSIMRKAL